MHKKELTPADVWAMFAETNRQMKETDRKLKEMGIHVDGISKSNGAFAEEVFYNSLEKSMEFAGVHYDRIDNSFRSTRKMPDGSKLEDQFDIVLINSDAIAIIEIKYKASSDDVEELATKKINNFRSLFPKYNDFAVYLGLGTLSFNEYVVNKAKELGVGLLKLSGDVVKYKTSWVRAFK